MCLSYEKEKYTTESVQTNTMKNYKIQSEVFSWKTNSS